MTDLTMKAKRPTPRFQEFNPDHSRRSARIQNEGRYSQGRLRTAEQRTKDLLLWLVSTNQTYKGNEAKQAVDLCFCATWHRPGGAYAFSTSERLKGFQTPFPGGPVPTTWFIPTSRQRELSVTCSANAAQQSAPPHLSAAEGSNFPTKTPVFDRQCTWLFPGSSGRMPLMSLSLQQNR